MEFITSKELMEKLKISRSTLERFKVQGMPHQMVGNQYRFDFEMVLRWLNRPCKKIDCNKCDEPGTASLGDFIECPNCKKAFHKNCLDAPGEIANVKNRVVKDTIAQWGKCPHCTNTIYRKVETE